MNLSREVKIKQALLEIQKGFSISSVAIKYGLPRSSLCKICKLKNIKSAYSIKLKNCQLKKEKARFLRKKGLSCKDVAKKLNISPQTANSWCKDILIDKKLIQNKNQRLAIKYRKKGLYITEIAKILKCSKSSVSQWLSAEVIKNPNLNDATTKRKKDLSVLHNGYKKHEKNIKKMMFLGLSYKDISNNLNISPDLVGKISRKISLTEEEMESIKTARKKRIDENRKNGKYKEVGGVREGVERSKFGYYKGIYCSSTYELCWVIYHLDHGKKVQRFKGFLTGEHKGKKFKYYPDFFEKPNLIIEIKGYEDKSVKKKTDLAKRLGYNIIVLKKENLKNVFKYVDKKYNVTRDTRHTLYDNYKPKYILVCDYCFKNFPREKLRNTKNVFCSSSCSGLFRAKVRIDKKSSQI